MFTSQIWRCPKCLDALRCEARTLACEQGHRYDLAKQGYVNLLLANQKSSKAPGDSAEMMAARREFLAAGHYKPLMEKLSDVVFLEGGASESLYIVDVGCGEGSYLKALAEQAPIPAAFFGVDISKPAVSKAAVLLKDAEFAVASNANLPLSSACADKVTSIFSPVFPEEIRRVLKPGGKFIRVLPGADHLVDLKSALFDGVVRPHGTPKVEAGFIVETHSSVKFQMQLTSRDVDNLLGMIPLRWRANTDAVAALKQQESMPMTADFTIQVLVPE